MQKLRILDIYRHLIDVLVILCLRLLVVLWLCAVWVSDFLDNFVHLQDYQGCCSSMKVHQWTNPCSHVLFCPQYSEVIFVGMEDMLSGPPRTPDLNPLDFFLWRFLKDKVYERESTSQSVLLNCIFLACKCVAPNMLRNVPNELYSRMLFCIVAEGSLRASITLILCVRLYFNY